MYVCIHGSMQAPGFRYNASYKPSARYGMHLHIDRTVRTRPDSMRGMRLCTCSSTYLAARGAVVAPVLLPAAEAAEGRRLVPRVVHYSRALRLVVASRVVGGAEVARSGLGFAGRVGEGGRVGAIHHRIFQLAHGQPLLPQALVKRSVDTRLRIDRTTQFIHKRA